MESIMDILNNPMLAALIIPSLVKVFSGVLNSMFGTMPKPLKPVMSIAFGALAAALGDMTWVGGLSTGVMAIGVCETAKPMSKKVAEMVKPA